MNKPSHLQPAFTGPDLCKLEAHEVATLLQQKKVSPKELLDASRERIEAVEPHINAMPTLCFERAEEALKQLDYSNAGSPGWLG